MHDLRVRHPLRLSIEYQHDHESSNDGSATVFGDGKRIDLLRPLTLLFRGISC